MAKTNFSLLNILSCTTKIVIVSFITASVCYGMSGLDLTDEGLKCLDKKQYDEAIVYFTKALEAGELSINDRAVVYNNRGVAYRNKQQYDRAMLDYMKSIELNPRDDKAYVNRGVLYLLKRQYDRAIEDSNKAIELNPRNNRAYYNKACIYSLTNKTGESCRLLEQSIEYGFNNWSYIKSDNDLGNIRDSACYKKIMSGR